MLTAAGGSGTTSTSVAGCVAGGTYLQAPTVSWLGASGTSWSSYTGSGDSTCNIGGCGGDGWFPGLLRKTHRWYFSYGSVGYAYSDIQYIPSPRVYNDLGEPWYGSAQQSIAQSSMRGGAGGGENYWYRSGGLGGIGYGAGGGGGTYRTNGSYGGISGGCSGQLVSYMHILTDMTSYAVTIGAAVTASSYQGAGAPGAVAVFW